MQKILVVLFVLVLLADWRSAAQSDEITSVLGCQGSSTTRCTIRYNGGGGIEDFVRAAHGILNGKRAQLVVDGECDSACIIAMDTAKARTCVTPWVKLGFHKAFYATEIKHADGTIEYKDRHNFSDMPVSQPLAAWVHAHGGFPKDTLLWMHYADAKRFWPTCQGAVPLPRARPNIEPVHMRLTTMAHSLY